MVDNFVLQKDGSYCMEVEKSGGMLTKKGDRRKAPAVFSWNFSINERKLPKNERKLNWLLATGSRDSQQSVKLWDARTGRCLATLHDHKNSVMVVQWNKNGNWLMTGSRDHVIKLYDVRMMREMQSFRGHKKVTALAWYPIHEGLFVSGGGDGSLGYWLVHNDKELALLEQTHDMAIWILEWHPLGYILATGSNDNNTKFWSRNRPGDTQEDVFGMTSIGGVLTSTSLSIAVEEDRETIAEESFVPIIPGMGIDESMRKEMNRDLAIIPSLLSSLPGLGPTNNLNEQGQQGRRQIHDGRQQPKRNQRQFERMWMVARPGGGTNSFEDYGPGPDEGGGMGMDYRHNPPMDGIFNRGAGVFYPQQQSLNSQQNMNRFPPPTRYF